MTRIDIAPHRRIVNPVQGDAVTFLETSEESGGVRSLGELEVAPGGKVAPHYHRSYSEHFKVTSGHLTVMVDGEDRILGPGEEAIVPAGTLHGWSNTSGETAVAEVELRPGQPGFERSLQVAYGLARDGKVLKNGMPRNPLHLALLLDWGDGRKAGVLAVMGPVFRLLAALARALGIDRRLIARYSRPM
jgi:quercetin dioxygenase-like cupin family protein